MPRRLPVSTKLAIVKRALSGESISKLAREVKTSRTILYRWVKQYRQAPSENSLGDKYKKGYSHYKRIKPSTQSKIYSLALKSPQLSFREIAKRARVSSYCVYRSLERKDLLTKESRESHQRAYGERLFKNLSTNEKVTIIRRYEAGDRVISICEDFHISRTTFYKWLYRYEKTKTRDSLHSLRPQGSSHWRYIPELQDCVSSVVRSHPEFSIRQITKQLLLDTGRYIASTFAVYTTLRRLGLTTYQARLSFAQAATSSLHQPVVGRSWELPQTPRYQFISDLPPPIDNLSKTFLRSFLPLVISSTVFVLFVFAGLYVIFQTGSILSAIGMIFAFISLIFGMFFFLYSIKYYLTVGIVLSFSRYTGEEEEKRGVGSLLGRIFGISIEVVSESEDSHQVKPRHYHSLPTGGLQPDLSGIVLDRMPFVSIHLSTYNEKRVIDRLLTAVTALEYDNYEVLVADDSTDETVNLLKKWEKHEKVKVIHRKSRDGYKGAALGNALKFTDPKAEFVLVFDADFIPYPDTIIQFLKYFKSTAGSLDATYLRDSTIAAVQGYQWHVLNKSENWVTRGVRSEYAGSYVIERSGIEIYGGLKQIAGSVYMIRRDVLERLGWGSSITEDFQLTLRLYEEGYKVVYTPYIQAPAEAVSTIKRLIRQRMRWSEGHSHNIKKMFIPLLFGRWMNKEIFSKLKNKQLDYYGKTENIWHTDKLSDNVWIPSILSSAEKFEFLYLSPYYLQALFFIIGTLCWFVAETIFRVQLPFWTEVLGWSLILTNLFALPLLNMVGLFLEESEEKDYVGVLSFILLSYLVAPFQAYASVKGFFEDKEGPWFRTPKTGRITDTFVPGRFYRYIRGIFGSPAVAKALAGKPAISAYLTSEVEPLMSQPGLLTKLLLEIRSFLFFLLPSLKQVITGVHQNTSIDIDKHLLYRSAFNSFHSFSQSGFRLSNKKARGMVNFIIVGLLLTSILLSYAAVPVSTTNASFTGTFYFRTTAANLLPDTSTAARKEMTDNEVGSSTQTFTLNSTNTTYYALTDNLSQKWDSDIKVANSTTGDKRNVDVAQDSDGNTYMVWEDSRNSQSANDTFTRTSRGMTTIREFYMAALLNNGKVLIAGGDDATNNISTAEIYDPTADTFTATSNNMSTIRTFGTATTLDNGKVLIAGGEGAGNAELSTADVYDPFTNQFTATSNNMSTTRQAHTATLLNNGQVLITGGLGANSHSIAELYDPLTNKFSVTQGGLNTTRQDHTASLLPNGKVLVVGGESTNGGTELSSAEIYDPVSQRFTYTINNLQTARQVIQAITLENGKVLVPGGFDSVSATSLADVYDPASNLFSTAGNMTTSRYDYAMTNLNNGKVLIIGGIGAAGLTVAEIYDTHTNTFKATSGNLAEGRRRGAAILLNDGRVFMPGGRNNAGVAESTAELYAPRTYDVYAQKYDKTGAAQWGSGTDVKVNSDDGSKTTQSGNPSNYDHLNPRVKLDSSNNPIVVWQESRNSAYGDDVYAQKLQGTDGAKLWPASSSSTDRFTATTGNMTINRDQHSIAMLQSGKIFVSGGSDGTNALSSAELYDPSANTFTATTGNMTTSRRDHSSTVSNNGKVLVAGGWDGTTIYSSAQTYDPSTSTFSATSNNMRTNHKDHTATLLNTGKILIAGGCSVADCSTVTSLADLYDPSANTFTATTGNSTASRREHTATLLTNGKVLITGGRGASTVLSSAELYDPIANTFTATTGNMTTSRRVHSATLLNNGKVFVVAGTGAGSLSSADLYDPSTNTFTATTGNSTVSRLQLTSTLLNNGKVLVAGGCAGSGCSTVYSTANLYDPSADTFTATTANMTTTRNLHKATLLNNGKVLIIGGFDGTNSLSTAELYLPAQDITVSNHGSPTNGWGLPRPEFPDSSKGVLGEQRNPALAVDGGGSVAVVWEGTKMGAFQNWDLTFSFNSSAYYQSNVNLAAQGWCNGGGGTNNSCGGTSPLSSRPTRILGQKLSSSDGSKQWGDDVDGISQDNPQDIILSTTGDSNRNPTIEDDGTSSFFVSWDSDGQDLATAEAYKDRDIYSQKIDTNGAAVWGGTFTATTGGLVGVRHDQTATLLANGSVLIAAGCSNAGADADCDTAALTTAELYNQTTGRFSATTGGLTVARGKNTATYLPTNGKVLLAGGCNGNNCNVEVSSAELYDPSTSRFTATSNNLSTFRLLHTATLISDGKVLVSGGCVTHGNGCTVATTVADLYDPIANTFTTTTGGQTVERLAHTASLLHTGKVLLTGGCQGASTCGTINSSAELYDPSTGRFTATSNNLSASRHEHTATTLHNGKVLIAGGCSDTGIDCDTSLSSADLYNPVLNTFSTTRGNMTVARAMHTAVLLNNGKVLISGGCTGTDCVTEYSSSELYDSVTDAFTAVSFNMPTVHVRASASLLTSGMVLTVGGCNAYTSTGCIGSAAISSSDLFSYDQKINTNDIVDQQNPAIVYDSSGDDVIYTWQGRRGSGAGGGAVSGDSDRGGGSWKIYGQKTDNPALGSVTKQWPSGTAETSALTTGGLKTARAMHIASMLNDGRVLIAGGTDFTNNITSAEIYDPSSSRFETTTGGMATNRAQFTATLLQSGKVLITSGCIAANCSTQTSLAETYDPDTSRFTTTTGGLATARKDHSATLLNDGTVLVVGGDNTSGTSLTSAEVYTPSTGRFTATTGGMTTTVSSHTATLLFDGRVLVAGGFTTGTTATTIAQLYNPSTGRFTATTGGMLTARGQHTATLLNNGKVMLVAGVTGSTLQSSSELFDPVTSTFSLTTGGLIVARNLNTGTLLASGKVLVAGGCDTGACGTGRTTTAELFDPVTGRWSNSSDALTNERVDHTATLLVSGNILFTAGADLSDTEVTTAELYNPSGEMMLSHDFALPADQEYPDVALDSTSPVLVWQDNRTKIPESGTTITSDNDVYMQKVDSNGVPQWPAASTGAGYTSPYGVLDVRGDTYEATGGGTGTHFSGKPRIAGVASITGFGSPYVIAFEDNRNDGTNVTTTTCGRSNSSTLTNICAQSYDTSEVNISQSTNWQALFYMSSASTPTINVDTAVTEFDGVQNAKLSLTQTWTTCSPSCAGGPSEQTLTWTDNDVTNPPPSDTIGNVTMRRLRVRFTRTAGSVVLSYDNSSVNSRLTTGSIVPENLLMFGLLIPAIPPFIYYLRRRRQKRYHSMH